MKREKNQLGVDYILLVGSTNSRFIIDIIYNTKRRRYIYYNITHLL